MGPQEIESCIREYGNDIYRFCCFLTKHKEKADDLYQDTFLTALDDERAVAEEDRKKFMIGIAANLWKNKWRKEKRRSRYHLYSSGFDHEAREDMIDRITDGQDVLERCIAAEDQRIVRSAVDHLSEKYRVPILMYYSAELSTKDIAEQLHISKGTVTSRLKRARALIEKELKERGYEE